jgi:hypothetical protein
MAICLVAAALAGCSSGPDAKATADRMGAFGLETAKVNDAIDDTTKSLDALVGAQPADIKPRFEAYTKSLAALDEQAKVVRAEAEKMKASGDAFFKEWETDAAATVSPERRAELSAAYAKIKEDMAVAGEAFTPFLASLKDIQSYLSLDLSLKGINSVAEIVKTAKGNGAQVKSHIESVITQVNSVRGMLSTKPKK